MNEYAKVLIPMIRKVMPTTIAQQIVGVQPMNIEDNLFTQFFGEHEYNKKHWPYQTKLSKDLNHYEAERWCWNRFKGRYWNSKGRQFVFKREKDYVMFILRWGT